MVSIFSDSWIDLIFEGRNQQYGAFELRKQTPRNSFAAGFISLSLLGTAIVIPMIINLIIGQSPSLIVIPYVSPGLVDPPVNIVVPVKPILPPPPHTSATPPTIIAPDLDVTAVDLPTTPDVPVSSTKGSQTQPGSEGNAGGVPATGTGTPSPVPDPDKPFIIVELMPAFPGGESALLKYVGDNTHYPPFARENDIEGTVYVQFVVDAHGSVTDVKVIHSVDKFLDKEAIRVISSLPKWAPGKQNGKEVPVQCMLPIRFQLNR